MSRYGRRGIRDPTELTNLEAWYPFNTGITVVGAGVDTWADLSGNGNDLVQATDADRPTVSNGEITFDGSNFLQASFTLNQPFTVYLLNNQPQWNENRYLCDATTVNNNRIRQTGSTPDLAFAAGVADISFTGPTLGTFAVITVVWDGASSFGQSNKDTGASGNPGTLDAGGFTLGVRGSGTAGTGVIGQIVKEITIYNVAHDADTRNTVQNYLSNVGGLGL